MNKELMKKTHDAQQMLYQHSEFGHRVMKRSPENENTYKYFRPGHTSTYTNCTIYMHQNTEDILLYITKARSTQDLHILETH